MTWDGDAFERKKVSESYEKLAELIDEEAVFLVNGSFGSGKTFFANKWAADLRSRDIPVMLFDAWRNDYFESPLAGFITSLETVFGQGRSEESTGATTAIRNFAIGAAPVVLKAGLKVVAKLVSMGAIDGDLDTIKEVLASEGVESVDDLSNATIEAFSRSLSQKEFHEDLRSRFSQVIDEVLANTEQDSLYVFIDELDRCRPEFAFHLLEDIKHFLGVPKVKFFIFCDAEVLESQAAKLFGSRKSGEKYLEKFHTYKMSLPVPNLHNFILDHLNDFSRKFHDGVRWSHHDSRSEYLASMISGLLLSPRQAKSIVEFSVICSNFDPLLARVWPLTIALSVMRTAEPDKFKEFLSTGYIRDFSISGKMREDDLLQAVEVVLKSTSRIAFDGESKTFDFAANMLSDIGGVYDELVLESKMGFAESLDSLAVKVG